MAETIFGDDRRRMRATFGSHDLTPMVPRVFYDQLFPLMARVYVEVSDKLKELDMVPMDKRVWGAIVRILGFDPAADRYQYAAELAIQLWALARAREAVQALYLADEIEQLDGDPAMEFAAGWVRGIDFFIGIGTCHESEGPQCQRLHCPTPELVEVALTRELGAFKAMHPDQFAAGYQQCIKSKTNPGSCLMACTKVQL